jgi:hypothetical protein
VGAWRQIPRIVGVLALTALGLWMLVVLPLTIYWAITKPERRSWFMIPFLALTVFVIFAAAYFVRLLWRRIYADADAEASAR